MFDVGEGMKAEEEGGGGRGGGREGLGLGFALVWSFILVKGISRLKTSSFEKKKKI